MKHSTASRFAPIVIASKPPTPRFGVMHTRREAPKKGEFSRKVKHCGRAACDQGVCA